MTAPSPNFNVKAMFGAPPWPVVRKGATINRVQKKVDPRHVTGIPANWPQLYYGQGLNNLNQTRTYRNRDVSSLPDGSFLYLIEYDPAKHLYHKSFVQVLNLLETGSRHFQLPTRNQGRVIVAAGELQKQGKHIWFNLESGTYTRELMALLGGPASRPRFVNLVKNALRSNEPDVVFENAGNRILLPQVPATLKNLLNSGQVTFFFNSASAKTKANVQAWLNSRGATNAPNLIRKYLNEGPSPKRRRGRAA